MGVEVTANLEAEPPHALAPKVTAIKTHNQDLGEVQLSTRLQTTEKAFVADHPNLHNGIPLIYSALVAAIATIL